jgi:hypothetical protein
MMEVQASSRSGVGAKVPIKEVESAVDKVVAALNRNGYGAEARFLYKLFSEPSFRTRFVVEFKSRIRHEPFESFRPGVALLLRDISRSAEGEGECQLVFDSIRRLRNYNPKQFLM